MNKREQQFKRALVLLALVVLAFAGLGYRLVDLQVLRHDELAKQAEEKTQQTSWRTANAATFWTRTAICWPRAFR